MNPTTHTLIDTGTWSTDVAWELYTTSVAPPEPLCSAVMCVAIADDKIVLARSKRGWGMLGGHIEDNETPAEALRREAHEEGGYTIHEHELFAVRKITSQKPVPHPQPGKMYPYPVSYMAYYLTTTRHPLMPHSGEEIIESGQFTLDELRLLGSSDQHVIETGWKLLNSRFGR